MFFAKNRPSRWPNRSSKKEILTFSLSGQVNSPNLVKNHLFYTFKYFKGNKISFPTHFVLCIGYNFVTETAKNENNAVKKVDKTLKFAKTLIFRSC